MKLIHGDCLEEMKNIKTNSVDLILTDIPYGEVNQKSSGLRLIDREKADICEFDVFELIDELNRICRGSFYIFCGTEQISKIVTKFKSINLSTRVGGLEQNKSKSNERRVFVVVWVGILCLWKKSKRYI